MDRRKVKKWPKVPASIVAAAVVTVLVLGGAMFSRDLRREKSLLKDNFLQRGEVLIHSLEMVGRVRFGENWEETAFSDFWNNLEDSDNVVFLALTDNTGRPLVVTGQTRPDPGVFRRPEPMPEPLGAIAPHHRIEKVGDGLVYMVYRPFLPIPRPPRPLGDEGHHGGAADKKERQKEREKRQKERREWAKKHRQWLDQHKDGDFPPPPGGPRYVWVGFNMSPFEQASRARMRTAGLFVALFSLAGLAGILALFWGHSSRLARRMYEDTNAMAAELMGRLPTGVMILDREGGIRLVNQAARTISGLKEKDLLGRTPQEITFGRFPDGESLSGHEVELTFENGHSPRLALTAGPIIGEGGQPLGRVILMDDVGEVGRLKGELAKKERLATLGGLAAGLAHEIRNPLGAIRGLSQHLLNKGTGDAADRQSLKVMLASVDRLNATITDFLDYARPAEIRTAPVDLGQLLASLATLVGHDAQSRSVELALSLPPGPVVIDGDESRLAQAFMNLYLNAIQAAGPGGGKLVVTVALADGRAVITFRDNGPGFSPEQLAQAFIPYFTTKADGTGLGLALVEKTIRAHEGADISLASPAEGGGLVTISFRLKNG